MWAGMRRTPRQHRARATPEPVCIGWQGGHGEGLRRTHGYAAGAQLGTHPVDRSAVNVGTRPGLPFPPAGHVGAGQLRRQLMSPGGDGAAVVGRGREGKSATWPRAAACPQRQDWHARRSPVITGAPWPTPTEVTVRVLGLQAKLHRWASEDPARRFDDLFNLVVDPAVLLMAWRRVRSNRGARATRELDEGHSQRNLVLAAMQEDGVRAIDTSVAGPSSGRSPAHRGLRSLRTAYADPQPAHSAAGLGDESLPGRERNELLGHQIGPQFG